MKLVAEELILPGNVHLLMEQIGTAEVLGEITSSPELTHLPKLGTLADLQKFLEHYHEHVLAAIELPNILAAFRLGASNQVRELVELDRSLANTGAFKSFARASAKAGFAQLQRLRPAKDERIIQRYLAAVEKKEAHGWHALVYGLTLAVYSFPLRTGLLTYGTQITRGFLEAGGRSLQLSRAQTEQLFDELHPRIVQLVEKLMAGSAIG